MSEELPGYTGVWIKDDEYDFMVRFDPDRERSCNRRELIEVIEFMQTVLIEGRVTS